MGNEKLGKHLILSRLMRIFFSALFQGKRYLEEAVICEANIDRHAIVMLGFLFDKSELFPQFRVFLSKHSIEVAYEYNFDLISRD